MADADRETLLLEQIDSETLKQYTKWKFPELDVNEKTQCLLLSHLDRKRYKLIGDLDCVINGAAEAVEHWKATKPALFETGTDYVMKSLVLADHDFNPRLPFDKEMADGFLHHHHRVRLERWW